MRREPDLETIRLNKIASDTAYQLEMDRARYWDFEDWWQPIKEATPLAKLDFICRTCDTEGAAVGRKRVIGAYEKPIAFYSAKCRACGSEMRRRITHKLGDPFYTRSRAVRRQRAKYRVDTLQPGEWGFNTHWGKASMRKFVEEQVEKEKAVYAKYDDPSTRLARSFKMMRELKHADYRNHGKL